MKSSETPGVSAMSASSDELSAAAHDYARASLEADKARTRLRHLVRAVYAEGGVTKATLAASAGISRPTLDKWLSV